jgi:hypothetical protein
MNLQITPYLEFRGYTIDVYEVTYVPSVSKIDTLLKCKVINL